MSTSNSKISDFIAKLATDHPEFKFTPGQRDHWSPKTSTITYNPNQGLTHLEYSMFHELSHALLKHTNYYSDFELLQLEAAAWQLAAKLGKKYRVRISEDHIQDCLDTYRDWLHRRSTCPNCNMQAFQNDPKHYKCFNCGMVWQVTIKHFVRPYRLKAKTKSA